MWGWIAGGVAALVGLAFFYDDDDSSSNPRSPNYRGPFPGGDGPVGPPPAPEDRFAVEPIPGMPGALQFREGYAEDAARLLHDYSVGYVVAKDSFGEYDELAEIINAGDFANPLDMMAGAPAAQVPRVWLQIVFGPPPPGSPQVTARDVAISAHNDGASVWLSRRFEDGPKEAAMVLDVVPQDGPPEDAPSQYVRLVAAGAPWPWPERRQGYR